MTLRAVWAPDGAVTTARTAGWNDLFVTGHADEAAPLLLNADLAARHHDGPTVAYWSDPAWQAALDTTPIVLTATTRELRIELPPVWRAELHLAWDGTSLLISSDLRTLAWAVDARTPDPDGAAAFLTGERWTRGLLPSLYRGILTLQPGHAAVVRPDRTIRTEATWAPHRDPAHASQPLETSTVQLRDRLDDLADRILTRHRRVACLFSGGLDSTLIAAALLRRAPERVVLLNVGSGLGTPAEERLRERFLRQYGARSEPVDLPAKPGLVAALRDVNAMTGLPTGSPFAAAFEEILAVAHTDFDCDAIATGDGGDEVFAERDELLVDLLARHPRALPPALGHHALRTQQRGLEPLLRAHRTLRYLRGHAPAPGHTATGLDTLLGDALARQVASARARALHADRERWLQGWTWSALGSARRAAAVPEWEPASTQAPGMAVLSPLVDAQLIAPALALRRTALQPSVAGFQPKWLLRQAALAWLDPQIALHPKIGSADGTILQAVRTDEHGDLLDLLGSTTAQQIGLRLPSEAERPDHPLWHDEGWIRPAALAAWLDQPVPRPHQPSVTLSSPPAPPTMERPPLPAARHRRRAARRHVVALAALNVAHQLLPGTPIPPARVTAADPGLGETLTDLARRACAFPLVSGASQPMSQALAHFLRLRGRRATAVYGVQEGRPGARYWVETATVHVDVHGAETPLTPAPEVTAAHLSNSRPGTRR
ncbi:asparagine synthase C-terminal domain-containing protein (plasmid) [Streptomyces viridifaciens]|nr:asparagine synthase C-terminal domain-containing protein [Streptomyces viridifaciens]